MLFESQGASIVSHLFQVCASLYKFIQVHKSLSKFAKVCPKIVRVRQSLSEFVRVRQSLSEFVKIRQSSSEFDAPCNQSIQPIITLRIIIIFFIFISLNTFCSCMDKTKTLCDISINSRNWSTTSQSH